MEEDSVKKIIYARKKLKIKIRKLEKELFFYRRLLDLVDSLIIDKTIVSAESLLKQVSKPIILTSKSGVKLGTIEKYEDRAVFKPATDIKIRVDKPPFSTYFIKRVLTGWKIVDDQQVRSGALSPDKMFDYEIIEEDNILKQLIFKNPREKLPRLMKQLRWTIEKQLKIE